MEDTWLKRFFNSVLDTYSERVYSLYYHDDLEETMDATVKVISDVQIRHRSETQGTVLTRVTECEVTIGDRTVVQRVEYWHDWESGRLMFCR